MWLSHYSFHFLTSYGTVIPTAQRFAASLGWHVLGTPEWSDACCRPVADWLPRLEISSWTSACSCRSTPATASRWRGRTPAAWRAFAPWAVLIVLLFAAGVWIVLQPMQMRGTLARMG